MSPVQAHPTVGRPRKPRWRGRQSTRSRTARNPSITTGSAYTSWPTSWRMCRLSMAPSLKVVFVLHRLRCESPYHGGRGLDGASGGAAAFHWCVSSRGRSPAVLVCLHGFHGVVLILCVVPVFELIRRCIGRDRSIDLAQDLRPQLLGHVEWMASMMRPICTLRSAMRVPPARDSISACSRPAAIMPVFTSTVVSESTRVS